MRGWPLREWCLILLVGFLLAVPLVRLTRPQALATVAIAPDDSHAPVDAWGQLRFSHAPERFALFLGDVELARGGGEARAEFDAPLALDHGAAAFRLELAWPAGAGEAYAELTVEPDGLPARTAGAWGRGLFNAVLEMSWPHQH
jgi:hypothetical protein